MYGYRHRGVPNVRADASREARFYSITSTGFYSCSWFMRISANDLSDKAQTSRSVFVS